MAQTSTYLNFPDQTEAAFTFYKSVFGGEFVGGISRFRDMPPMPGMPPMREDVGNLVMHVELKILGGHRLLGTDAPASMGFSVIQGNNMYINLEPDTKEEAERLFNALSEGGTIEQPLADMFWGAYFGSFADKFGMRWMVNYSYPQ